MVDSTDFSQVLLEADDIARSVSQRVTSAHVLLALFTVENRGQLLLRDRGIDEDRLLAAMTAAPREEEGLVRELGERAREIAQSCGSEETDCLHLLIAVTRVRCLAQDLLTRVDLDLSQLRNTALSYFLSGRMPRKLQLGRSPLPRGPAGRGQALSTSRSAPAVAVGSGPSVMSDGSSVSADEAESLRTAALPVEEFRPDLSAQPVGSTPPQVAQHPYELDPRTFPLLQSLGRNLSLEAARQRLDPVIGRAKEIDEVVDVLGKRRTNNPCLVGEPGVGKTAVVEGVAQKLLGAKGGLGHRIVVEIDMASLVAGTQLRGSFSEKLNQLKSEVKRAEGRVLVFIDEIHTLIGAGAAGEGAQDAANELKAALSRGEFPCIGATTHDEYRKFITQDPALERRFTPIVVNEPSIPETLQILSGVIARYEEHHHLTYSPAALQAAASLAAKYVSDRFLPDKALSLADLAGSRCRREGKSVVQPEDVARVVAKLAGLPEERLLMQDSDRLLRIEEDLACRVVGHRDAAAKIARVIRRNYAGFAARRPMGSFLFLGPTGVGKTEMARALANVLFGSRDALVRIDMSELSEAHGISRMIGAPPGYVGYGEGGQLTEPVRRRPSSVVVLDEIDKAHREVLMLLLQVLEEGRLTDGKGRHIDFSNTVIVATSNLGAETFARRARTVGFTSGAAGTGPNEEAVSALAKKALPPELWNRIDERLIFWPLAEPEIARIASLLLAESSERLVAEKGIQYFAGEDVIELLLRSGGYDPELGARPMRQTLQRLVEAPLAERILQGDFGNGDRIRVQVGLGQLHFQREDHP